MTIRRVVVLVLLLSAGTLASGSAALIPVRIHIAATDSAGLPVTDLTSSDVEVLVGGKAVPAEIDRLTPEQSTLVFLIDASDSVPVSASLFPKGLQEAVSLGLQTAGSSEGRVLIHGIAGPFGSAPLSSTAEPKQLTDLFRSIASAAREPSPLWDATIRSIETAREGDTNALALLLLTDGRATGNRCSVNDAVRVALQRGATISAVRLGAPSVVDYQQQNLIVVDPSRIMRQVTDTTGGLLIPSLTGQALGRTRDSAVKEAARTIGRWLEHSRSRYRVHLELPASDIALALSVRVRRNKVTVNAPTSYMTGGGRNRCLIGS